MFIYSNIQLFSGVVKVNVQIDSIGKLILTSIETPTSSNGRIEYGDGIPDEDNEQDKDLDQTEDDLETDGISYFFQFNIILY